MNLDALLYPLPHTEYYSSFRLVSKRPATALSTESGLSSTLSSRDTAFHARTASTVYSASITKDWTFLS